MQANTLTPSCDSYYRNFSDASDMMLYHHEQATQSLWKPVPISSIIIESLDGDSPLASDMSRFPIEVSPDAVTDTVRNLGLAAMVDGTYFPVRTTAYKSLLDRAKINGTALPKLPRPALAEVLNACLQLFPTKQALVLIRDEKIAAFHGGDQHDYSALPIDKLMSVLQEHLDERFPGNVFQSGYTDHILSTAIWEFPMQRTELLDTYIDALTKCGKATMASRLVPGIRFTTSDVGMSAASVSALLFGVGRPIRIGSVVAVEHRRQSSVDQFETAVDMLFSQYGDTVAQLCKLMDIWLQYPVHAMKAVCKKLTLPKKAALEAVALFEAAVQDEPATAHDVFLAMQEILYLVKNTESANKLLSIEESLSRAMTLKWSDYDFAKEVSW